MKGKTTAEIHIYLVLAVVLYTPFHTVRKSERISLAYLAVIGLLITLLLALLAIGS